MTIFERIAAGEIPANIVHQDSEVLAFHDINPQAPVHILVVPKRLISRVGEAQDTDEAVLGQLLLAARDIAKSQGLDRSGYRLVINNGPDAGEAVPHLHVHLLGGRPLDWPPG
jgi:histidine triad (HIT) family protein